MQNKKLLVLEINEVPNRVIETYVEDYPTSNFAAIYPKSAKFVAATPDTKQLHPKISWQTFHRGVPDHKHGIAEYNQPSPNADYETVWEVIKKAGKSVGCGGSIGSYPLPENMDNVGFYLPDPFAPTFETVPAHLSHFQRFNNLAVQRSGRNVRTGGFNLKDVGNLLINLPRLGISVTTISKIVKQLIQERSNRNLVIRRRNIQALMTFDVVFAQLKKQQPDFSTIFVNHVAANMHRYWAAKFPNDYVENKMPQVWRDTYSREIDSAMHEADYMLGKVHDFVKQHPEYSVLTIASMGQEGIEHEVVNNQLIINNFDAFMSSLDFAPSEYRKLTGMEPEYVVDFTEEAGLERFKTTCSAVNINNQKPTVKPSSSTQCSFLIFQNNIDIESITVNEESISLVDAGLKIEKIQDMSGSTAQHIPGGCCFVFNGSSDLSGKSNLNAEIDLTAVTASVLSALDVEQKPYMLNADKELVNAILA